jgi:hypothetical protein
LFENVGLLIIATVTTVKLAVDEMVVNLLMELVFGLRATKIFKRFAEISC